MKRITIEPVTRIEGHAKITIQLDDQGKVADTRFQVTQVRGFEKFVEGRPFYEMPGITARICGICPVSHELASAKACDAIMAVRIPKTAHLLRELLHCAQFVQSHALSFFYLSSPDLLLGMDCDPATRNIAGVIEKFPDVARDGIELRKFGLQIVEGLAQERVHPSWVVPGGVNAPMTSALRDRILADLPGAFAITEHALSLLKSKLDALQEEIDFFGTDPTLYAALVDGKGQFQLYDGAIRFVDTNGDALQDAVAPEQYADFIGEASLRNSYLKAPYYKPNGYPAGVYRVGPLARLNVADHCGTPRADQELAEFQELQRTAVLSSFHYHHARLIEILYCVERIEQLLNHPEILSKHVRAVARPNAQEGVGVAEAPRGTLFHHYKIDDQGLMRWVNLIIATGQNNLAMNKSVLQVAKHFVKGDKLTRGMLNRVEAVIRAYDPCLSCSTHAVGHMALKIQLLAPDGALLDEVARN